MISMTTLSTVPSLVLGTSSYCSEVPGGPCPDNLIFSSLCPQAAMSPKHAATRSFLEVADRNLHIVPLHKCSRTRQMAHSPRLLSFGTFFPNGSSLRFSYC